MRQVAVTQLMIALILGAGLSGASEPALQTYLEVGDVLSSLWIYGLQVSCLRVGWLLEIEGACHRVLTEFDWRQQKKQLTASCITER